LRTNGGGDICLGYQVIHRLMKERHPEGIYDMRHSPITDLFVRTAEENDIEEPIFGDSIL